MTAGMPDDRLRRQAHHHALPVGWEQLDYPTFLERRRTLIARVTREGFARLWGAATPAVDASVEDLIRAGESQTIEFKSTARYNAHIEKPDARLEHVIVKTVCGFLNAEGGSLIIGVADDGSVLGLEEDLATLGAKANRDGYELFLRQLLDNGLSVSTAATVRIRFPVVDGKEICLVSVAASGRPVFARPPKGSGVDGSEFWVRIGNATKQLHGDDMLAYEEDHWG
jgi:predicted HTH transcriptional regulator